MDVSEYRRQVEAEAEAAARREPAFKKALRNARPSGRAGGGASPMPRPRRKATICPSRWRCSVDSDATERGSSPLRSRP